jgi:hypothetical protein
MKLRKMYGERCSFDGVYPKAIKLGKRAKDLTGKRFGRLVVLKPIARQNKSGNRQIIWYCQCDCGVRKRVAGMPLKNGDTKSCGCLNIDRARELTIKRNTKGFNKYVVVDDTVALVLTSKNGCVSGLALIDAEDLDLVKAYSRWCMCTNGYVSSVDRAIFLSRLVMHKKLSDRPNLKIDHINRDPLDNRKQNLRVCTQRQNTRNRAEQSNSSTGYKGVCWVKQKTFYRATICTGGKTLHLGYFSSAEEAAKAYDKAAVEHFGEFAYTNFT